MTRTLDSHVAYYERWAKTWEFQALLKARPMCGDMALGKACIDAVNPMVWTAAERDDFVVDVQRCAAEWSHWSPRTCVSGI